MAVGNFTPFNKAKLKLGQKIFNLGATDVFKMALTTSAQSIDATFVGTSTDCRYSDLTAQVANGNGYTTGGKTLTATWTQATGTMTWDVDDQTWSASSITAHYAVIYDDTATNKDLLCFCDFGADFTSSSGNFVVTINGSGVFTLA